MIRYALLLLGIVHAETRQWTISGHVGTAEFIEQNPASGAVRLKLEDGRLTDIPLERFSKVDQDWISSQKGDPDYTGKWPPMVEAPTTIPVGETPDGDGVIYTTDHYEFHSPAPLGKNIVREFARLFECVHKAVEQSPFDLNPQAPAGKFVIRLFVDTGAYVAAGGIPGSSGCYLGGTSEILVPLTSLGVKKIGNRYTMEDRGANQTLTHELTHQLMRPWLMVTSSWLSEGWAEFFTAQRYQTGRMKFSNPGRSLAEYLKEFRGAFDGKVLMPSPLDLILITDDQWRAAVTNGRGANQNYTGAAVLAAYFILSDEDGKPMWNYLRAIEKIAPPRNRETEKKLRDAVEEHLVRGRSRKEMEDAVESALRRYGLKVEFTTTSS